MEQIGIYDVDDPDALLTHANTVFNQYTEQFANDFGFDDDIVTITNTYIFGIFAASEAIPNESDLDIAICVEAWDEDEASMKFTSFTESLINRSQIFHTYPTQFTIRNQHTHGENTYTLTTHTEMYTM